MLSSAAMGGAITRLNSGPDGVKWTDPKTGTGVTAHGFRSTFRDWASEISSYPSDVAEQALAHVIGSKVEAAYRRGDLLNKRRTMMRDWAGYCARVQADSKVTHITQARRSAAPA
jgi:integrase